MHQDLEQLKQRLPLLDYLLRATGRRAAWEPRPSLWDCVPCIRKATPRSMSTAARICSTAMAAAAVAT